MPEISRFYGIIIKMYFLSNEHNPPHIHAFYNKNVAVIDLQSLEIIEGFLPQRALKMVREWLTIHQKELISIWATQEFKKIEPLN